MHCSFCSCWREEEEQLHDRVSRDEKSPLLLFILFVRWCNFYTK
jgi:hypothetical protein